MSLRNKSWTSKEDEALKKVIRRSTSLADAVAGHNRAWKTERTAMSADMRLRRIGIAYGAILGVDLRARRREDAPVDSQIQALADFLKRNKAASATQILNHLELCPKRLHELVLAARDTGLDVRVKEEGVLELGLEAPRVDRLAVHRIAIEPIKDKIRFAAFSDPHFASHMRRSECLKDFMMTAYHDYGVRLATCSGDIVAGIKMYKGQENEVETSNGERQLECAIRELPALDGLEYKIIGGNHDESFYKNGGLNITKHLAEKRSDVEDLGWYSALVDLYAPGKKNSIKAELYHPEKAGAYALSYHLQNAIRDIPPGMKPQIILAGHEHQALHLPDNRGIAAFLCGCFEDQTLYLKRKHKQPAIGGWILELGITKSGSLKSITQTWVKYYHSRRGSIINVSGVKNEDGTLEEVRMDKTLCPNDL